MYLYSPKFKQYIWDFISIITIPSSHINIKCNYGSGHLELLEASSHMCYLDLVIPEFKKHTTSQEFEEIAAKAINQCISEQKQTIIVISSY